MVRYIQELLFEHNCVIVPGLGAFIANYQPSKVKLYESRIYPPSKSIAFNRSLKTNDGLLTAYTAQQENCSYKEAEEKVNDFIQSCQAGLEKNKSYIFKDIGRLFYDNNNNLLFEPAETLNFLLQAYSFPPIVLEPIDRMKSGSKDIHPKIENDKEVEKMISEIETSRERKRKRSRLAYWFTFVLAIGLLSSVIGVSLQRGDFSNINRSSFFPDFNTLIKTTAPAGKPKAQKIIIPATQQPVAAELNAPGKNAAEKSTEAVPAKENSVPAKKLPKAYIVVGAFFDEQYAAKARSEAEEKGFHTVQIDEYDGSLHRVMVETDIEKVNTDLAAIKNTMNARAWVYCSNCSY